MAPRLLTRLAIDTLPGRIAYKTYLALRHYRAAMARRRCRG